ncbi:MAG: NAD kinase [Bacteroidetes bacterium]|nr:NAD kinase [Bacteroidota bacterium]
MKIALFGKNINNESIEYMKLLVEQLENTGIAMMVYEPFFKAIENKVTFNKDVQFFREHTEIHNQVNFLLSVGGDGTLLDTITLVRDSGVPILGINLGRLGFLASINKEMIIPAINAIIEGNYTLDKRTLVKIETENNLFGKLNYALNEMTVYKKNPLSMLTIKVFVNNEFLNAYWADGLIIATPTGSTAYSLSCGGPIITPDSENFIITPISTHNLTVRPIVIPDNSLIKIQVESRESDYFASLDSRFISVPSTTELTVKKEFFNINLLKMNNQNFFSTIRHKLLWGSDARN